MFAQQNASGLRTANARHTFVNPDGAFKFKYSNSLVQCPADSCVAYFPMCDYQISPGTNTLVCLAYKKSQLKDYPEFEAGTFSVAEIKDATTPDSCLSIADDWPGKQLAKGTMTIHGARFNVFSVGEAEMSQSVDGLVYRNLHKGKCYELGVRIATISGGIVGAKEFLPRNRNRVRRSLEHSLYSFRFLK